MVGIDSGSVRLGGDLIVPPKARGVVLFAHGSGSSRFSARNNYVAGVLREAGMGTLLFDLLTEDEAEDRANVFNIDLLASRLLDATKWTAANREAKGLDIGYFGASTGGAAALLAAVQSPIGIKAVVSRGGRPDMVLPILGLVKSPTLLIVGGEDTEVLKFNRTAYDALKTEKSFKVVPGATHLFEEPGKMEAVASLAREWFLVHFV